MVKNLKIAVVANYGIEDCLVKWRLIFENQLMVNG